jgi:hypothetical protein
VSELVLPRSVTVTLQAQSAQTTAITTALLPVPSSVQVAQQDPA